MTAKITDLQALDIRFPTSLELDGSDAVNVDPDYSAAYVILKTDRGDGVEGHGLAFTCGRGTEVVVSAINALRPRVIGLSMDDFLKTPGAVCRQVSGDTQIRWIGPEKGALHLATAAIINALWDLRAKVEGKPLWKLLCDLSPAQIVEIVDWRYITDALTPEEALKLLQRLERTRKQREEQILRDGLPAYTTSTGWLGYPDEKVRRLCREGIASGWKHFKIKVGASLEDDIRRCRLVREEIGPDRVLMIDANQKWDVPEAIAWVKTLAEFKPLWIEEPTSPDDVLGHAAIARALAPLGIGVATGEHCQNRVVFKQLMQANAIAFCQIDSTRLAGVNEVIAVLLLAAKFGIPVCPHAGGVGLCEYVQHEAIFDFICVSGTLENRLTEYVDHLHEHFLDPCIVERGHYRAPKLPGMSIQMKPDSIARHVFPGGSVWKNMRMSEFVSESDIDCMEVFRRGGRNLGDEDFALFRCPSCGRIYLIDYEVDTVYLDADDLAKRETGSTEPLRCATCGYVFAEPFIGKKADGRFWVSWADLKHSPWAWIAKQRRNE